MNTALELRKKIVWRIRKLKIKEIISIRLIGSFQYTKKLEAYNDVDLVIIVGNLNSKIFREINLQFDRIAKELESKNMSFIVETKRGPIKVSPINKKKIIQLHLLIYDVKSYKKALREPILFDINNFSTKVYGINPKKIKLLKRLSKKSTIESFNIHLKGIKSKTVRVGEYIIKKGRLINKIYNLKINQEVYNELNSHHLVVSFLDYLRFKGHNVKKIKKILLDKGVKILPKEHYQTLISAFLIKEKIRKNKKPTKEESKKLEKDAIKFITYLKNSISKN